MKLRSKDLYVKLLVIPPLKSGYGEPVTIRSSALMILSPFTSTSFRPPGTNTLLNVAGETCCLCSCNISSDSQTPSAFITEILNQRITYPVHVQFGPLSLVQEEGFLTQLKNLVAVMRNIGEVVQRKSLRLILFVVSSNSIPRVL